MPRPVDKYLFDHPEIWEQNNQARFDREPTFLAEVFRRYGSVERVLDVGCGTAHDIDEARQLQIATQSVFRIDDGALLQTDVTEFRLFFPQELRYLLESNAFRFLRFYGDFDLEHTSLDGTRLIAVAQKA